MEEYASGLPASEKSTSESTMLTVQFLKACNKMFERGIIGKRVFVKDVSCPIILNMEEGFHFFTSWLDEKLSQGNIISYSHAIFKKLAIYWEEMLSDLQNAFKL